MEDGNNVETQEELETTLNSYFSKILEDLEEEKEEAQREVLSHIPKLIMDEDNHILGNYIELK